MSLDENRSADNAPPSLRIRELAPPVTGVAAWWCELEISVSEVEACFGWLSEGERARAARFGQPKLRDRYVVGRASLRRVLGDALGLPPAAVPIMRGPRGRPRLDMDTTLDFNVSHTGDVAVIQKRKPPPAPGMPGGPPLPPGMLITGKWAPTLLVLTGPLAEGNAHPRGYGSFPRILGRYVRDERVLTLEEAIRKMTSLAANRVHLEGRGLLTFSLILGWIERLRFWLFFNALVGIRVIEDWGLLTCYLTIGWIERVLLWWFLSDLVPVGWNDRPGLLSSLRIFERLGRLRL